jgi:hypothetical protein
MRRPCIEQYSINQRNRPKIVASWRASLEAKGVSSLWDHLAGCLMTGRATTGVEGREADAGVVAELQEPVAPMLRGKSKRRRPQGEAAKVRIDARKLW